MSAPGMVSRSLVLLDANVVYSVALCDFFLTASSLALLARPVVTAEILAEARRNLAGQRPDIDSFRLARRFEAVRRSTDGHEHSVDPAPAAHVPVNDKDRLLTEHPDLEADDIAECLHYAAQAVQERQLPLRLPA